jgi:dipeptidyl aminopeptidase/acylaminoacyl peptidase
MSEEKKNFTPKHLTLIERLSDIQISRAMGRIVFTATHLHEDGGHYLSTIYRIPFDLELRDRNKIRVMTQRGKLDYHPRFAPKGELTFLSTRDKDVPQVYLIHSDGGEAQQITNLLTGVYKFEWLADAKNLIIQTDVYPDLETQQENYDRAETRKKKKREGYELSGYPIRSWDSYIGPKFPHLFVYSIDTHEYRDITPHAEKDYIDRKWEVSHDGKKIVVTVNGIGDDLRVYSNIGIIDIETAERTMVTNEKNVYDNPKISFDNQSIVCEYKPIQKGMIGKRDLVIINLKTGEKENITKDLDLWPFDPQWIPYSDNVLFHVEKEGTTQIWIYYVDQKISKPIVTVGHNYGTKISPDGRNILYIHERVNKPCDIYIKSIAHVDKPHIRITDFNKDLLNDLSLQTSEWLETEGSDGRKIQSQLIKPVNFDPNKKYPLLLFIHGGPYVSFRDRFSYRFNPQPYVNEGYVALRVNSRGSTGFGQKFIEDNKGKWGDLGYKDIIMALDKVSKEPFIDETRMAALGTSYGGYMVNWIATQKETADKFKCLVSFAGIYNLTSFYGTTDLSHKYEHEFDGTPFDNPEPYTKWSPASYAQNMKTPMLLIHGGRDYRVSYSESLQLYTALSRLGIESELLYFKEESHWIMKPNNYILFYETVLKWLKKHLS